MTLRAWTNFAAVLALMAMPLSATAISLNGEISFFGTFAPDDTDLSAAAVLSFPDDVFVGETLGDFAMGGPVLASFSTFDINSGGLVFTTDTGLSFTADGVTVDFVSPTQIDLTMTGTYAKDGFDDTAGTFILTGNTVLGDVFTFSGVGVAVIPAPAGLLLMGSALAALGLRRRKPA